MANSFAIDSKGKVSVEIIEALENQDLAVKYGANAVPLLVFDENKDEKIIGVPMAVKILEKLTGTKKRDFMSMYS